MSLNGALQIGRSALTVAQAGIQVAGNNMANAATPGFHRRSIHLVPSRDELAGRNALIGTGVELERLRREVDTALQARLRDALSDEAGATIDQRFLAAIETLQNELTDNDLSSILSDFFNAFSELANNPEDNAIRTVVVQEGATVGDRLRDLRTEYNRLRDEVDRSLSNSIETVNETLDKIALLNRQISTTEIDDSEAAALRDQRDLLIDDLAGFMDISVIEQANGMADVLVGSLPVVLNGQSRGIELRTESGPAGPNVSVRIRADGSTLSINSGSIGALMRQRAQTIEPAIDDINTFASQLIFQVNRIHSQGQGQIGYSSMTGTYDVSDPAVALNNPLSGLAGGFQIENGSFFIHVTNQQTGLRTAHRIDINGDTQSLNDLINEINVVVGVPNVMAGTSTSGAITLSAAAGFEISFSDDTSGALAALGINTFFSGTNAADIDVNARIQADSRLLAAGSGHVAGSNGSALLIADLQDAPITSLNGSSLRQFWQNSVNSLAVRTSAANAAAQSTALVRQSLSAQVQAVSGVSLDEESINLLMFQRQFQAAARFINVIDETLQTLISIA